ncbi:hypothetical protein TRIUR3_29489 [Triticum urartu]|uniref:Uncharacterized protein n=1 Tax=Triticum urartu TaxID=4572 RepID=M8A430_TRIUA|nr:hypothetical protein TRIUR3_29489 [Triticum urartu]
MMSMHTSPPLLSSSLEMPSPSHTCFRHAVANRGFSAGRLPRLSSTARRRRPLRWLKGGPSQGAIAGQIQGVSNQSQVLNQKLTLAL